MNIGRRMEDDWEEKMSRGMNEDRSEEEGR
jgi:hypothetical protein